MVDTLTPESYKIITTKKKKKEIFFFKLINLIKSKDNVDKLIFCA